MVRHFNESAAAEESQPARVMDALDIKPGDAVADLGAGGGYFTLQLARAVGHTGVVYAVDIESAYLDIIRSQLEQQAMMNVTLVLGTPEQSNLPQRSVDLVFVRDTFHHIREPVSYFARLRAVLKPGGRVAVIDYRPGGLVSHLHGHFVSEDEVVGKMEQAGYQRVKRHDWLAKQSFNLFSVRAASQAQPSTIQ